MLFGLQYCELPPHTNTYINLNTRFNECNLSILGIHKVFNPIRQLDFDLQQFTYETTNIPKNQIYLFHSTRGDINKIIKEGLNVEKSRIGSCGKGIYLTDCPLKANDYNIKKGDGYNERIMLRCAILPGRIKYLLPGQYNREYTQSPPGFECVSAFLKRSREYVIYNNSQVIITEVIRYRINDMIADYIPFDITKITYVLITQNLMTYYQNTFRMFSLDNNQKMIFTNLFKDLLENKINIDIFIKFATKITGLDENSNLITELKEELNQSSLDIIKAPSEAYTDPNYVVPDWMIALLEKSQLELASIPATKIITEPTTVKSILMQKEIPVQSTPVVQPTQEPQQSDMPSPLQEDNRICIIDLYETLLEYRVERTKYLEEKAIIKAKELAKAEAKAKAKARAEEKAKKIATMQLRRSSRFANTANLDLEDSPKAIEVEQDDNDDSEKQPEKRLKT